LEKNGSNIKTSTIYIQLLNEGTTVYRPALGEILGNGIYKILATENYDPEDEEWEFLPGSIVKCENKKLERGIFLVAVSKIEN
jgi:hypothetical protein